jgi:hypothetical protein
MILFLTSKTFPSSNIAEPKAFATLLQNVASMSHFRCTSISDVCDVIVLVPELLESAVVTVGGANGTVDPCPLAWVELD